MISFDCFFQWKEVDTTQLMDSKLKCVFVMPDNNGMSAGSAGKIKENTMGFIAYQGVEKGR